MPGPPAEGTRGGPREPDLPLRRSIHGKHGATGVAPTKTNQAIVIAHYKRTGAAGERCERLGGGGRPPPEEGPPKAAAR
ncbi:hypothetical protein J1C73_15660 [Streptomyces laculatispora]|nr:hypothetical protein [Streptomyces laculatispora]